MTDQLDQLRTFLRVRSEVRHNPGIVFTAEFRRANSPLAYAISESLFAGILVQLISVPINALLFEGGGLWSSSPGAALNQLTNSLIVLAAPLTYSAANLILAYFVAWFTSAKATKEEIRAVWLYFEGAYGFWGRFAFSALIYIASIYVAVAQSYRVNADYLVAFDFNDVRNATVAAIVWGAPAIALFSWLYFSVVDGTFAMVRSFVGSIHPRASAFERVWLYAKSLVLILVVRVGLFWTVLAPLLYFTALLIAFACYEAGHFIRHEIGLEPVGFVDLEDLTGVLPPLF